MGMSADFQSAVIAWLIIDLIRLNECQSWKFDFWAQELPQEVRIAVKKS